MEVTYIICNHNYKEFIDTAINSVLNQDYTVNCCIIDDGSTDGSVEYIENMFKEQKKEEGMWNDICYSTFKVDNTNITLLKLESNSGPSIARNIGIEYYLNDTDVFAILDMDDWVEPNKTSALLPYFRNPSVAVVYADYITYNEDDIRTRVFKEIFSRDRLVHECIVHSGSFISKNALLNVKDENGFYDENLLVAEDYDLWLRLSEKYTIIHHPDFLTHVRVTPKNSTNTRSQEVWQRNYSRVIEKLKLRNRI